MKTLINKIPSKSKYKSDEDDDDDDEFVDAVYLSSVNSNFQQQSRKKSGRKKGKR